MLTDTTYWVDLAQERASRQGGPAHQFLARHRTQALEVLIITWGEAGGGCEGAGGTGSAAAARARVMLHRQIAWEAGRIERELAQSGSRLGENDNWIAATARVWGLRLVSRDAAFTRVQGLRVVAY